MISNNRYCHDATADHFIKINWGKYLRLYSLKGEKAYYICFNINPLVDIHPSYIVIADDNT